MACDKLGVVCHNSVVTNRCSLQAPRPVLRSGTATGTLVTVTPQPPGDALLARRSTVGVVRVRHLFSLVGLVLLLVACSSSEPETTTLEDVLTEIEGREPTPAEVSQREKAAQLLCRLDDRVLVEIWSQMDSEQLQFQDFVFTRRCPDRNPLYAETTERFVTAE